MLLYVAGKWADKHIIKTYMNFFTKEGHVITHDWTVVEEEDKRTREDLAKYAELDVQGVKKADYLIILITDPEYAYRGTSCELGVALACQKPVIIVNLTNGTPDFFKSIFPFHKSVRILDRFIESEIIQILRQEV